MPYEMAQRPEYQAVRFWDGDRERFLIVRAGVSFPIVVAESHSQTNAVLIAGALNLEPQRESVRAAS